MERIKSLRKGGLTQKRCVLSVRHVGFRSLRDRRRFFLPEDQRDLKMADESEQQLQNPLAVLDQRLAITGYLVGPTFTVADLNVASVLSWARMGRVNLISFPHVDQWLAGCLKRPAAVKARPQTMAN